MGGFDSVSPFGSLLQFELKVSGGRQFFSA